MGSILEAIEDWIHGLLVSGIMGNLTSIFDSVNNQVGQIATEVGRTPASFSPAVYGMIRTLSENVIMPIAGLILIFIGCYELIQLVISHNNLANFETWIFWKWIFKTFVAVTLITNTMNITMAVFDVAQHVVSQAGGLIGGSTAVDASALATMQATLDVILIRYAGNDTETLLQAFCKLVGGAFQWGTINGEADVGFLCPAVAGGVHNLHDREGELLCFRIRMGSAGEIVYAFCKSGISEGYGGIAAIEKAVDGFSLLQSCKCSELPEYGSRIRKRCYAGLDLSSTGDITALVLMFPPRDADEKYILLPYFWVPEETIPQRVKAASVPYDIWERQGYLLSTEGNVIHYDFIEQFINDLAEKYHIVEIAVDRWNATQMIQNLEGDGFTMVPFGQGFASMSGPTKDFYRLLMEGKIIHGGHPVLRWMAGNVVVDTDPAGNIKVTKARSKEKIDGIVAAIMALDRCIRNQVEPQGSVYDDRGLLVLE